MGNDHHGRPQRAQLGLQPFDRGEIEMVRRFVEQQDVRFRSEHPGQCSTPRLAAGELRRRLVSGKAKLFEQVAGTIEIVGALQPGLDIRQRGREARQVGLLREIAQTGAGLDEALAALRLDQTGCDLQQG